MAATTVNRRVRWWCWRLGCTSAACAVFALALLNLSAAHSARGPAAAMKCGGLLREVEQLRAQLGETRREVASLQRHHAQHSFDGMAEEPPLPEQGDYACDAAPVPCVPPGREGCTHVLAYVRENSFASGLGVWYQNMKRMLALTGLPFYETGPVFKNDLMPNASTCFAVIQESNFVDHREWFSLLGPKNIILGPFASDYFARVAPGSYPFADGANLAFETTALKEERCTEQVPARVNCFVGPVGVDLEQMVPLHRRPLQPLLYIKEYDGIGSPSELLFALLHDNGIYSYTVRHCD
eukprot:TRINITY_DN3921_c0_g1_i3.p1 TRINITY_DN3921_c0_g1~~TRINITY_DN3921_c0_g1_i3.p1  ORF type:complete len:296 (+),score=70.77 TRINITY_DN3921_c0_g1_i3:56-943(+)